MAHQCPHPSLLARLEEPARGEVASAREEAGTLERGAASGSGGEGGRVGGTWWRLKSEGSSGTVGPNWGGRGAR